MNHSEYLLSARELAELLGFTPGWVLDQFEAGLLPGFKLGAGVNAPVRFRRSEIEAWLEGYRRGPKPGPERNLRVVGSRATDTRQEVLDAARRD